MQFSISWLEERTTSTGKKKVDATLVDLTGLETTGATIWEDFPNFANLRPGEKVEGDLVPNKNPQYGPTLYPPRVQSAKPAGMGAGMMKAKAESIAKSQERKEEGIMHASIFRAAYETALAESHTDFNDAEFRTSFTKWKRYYQESWNVPF